MADDDRDVEDVALIMERLWGPREHVQADVGTLARSDPERLAGWVSRPQRQTSKKFETGMIPDLRSAAAAAGGVDSDVLRRGVEAVLSERLVSLRSDIVAAVDAVDERVNRRIDAVATDVVRLTAAVAAPDARPTAADELAAVRAQMETDAAAQLAVLREEAVASADARVGVVEAGLRADLTRLHEEMQAEITRAAASTTGLEASRPLTDDERATLRSEMVADVAERLDNVREAALAAVAARATEVEGQMVARMENLSAQVATAMETSARAASAAEAGAAVAAPLGARIDELASKVDVTAADAAAGPAAAARIDAVEGQAAGRFAALEDTFARRLADMEAEMQRRIAAVLDDASTWAAEQLADRLDEMAAWVLAQATSRAERVPLDAAVLAPLRSDVRALQARVEAIAAAISGLKGRLPAPARQVPPARSEKPAGSATTGKSNLANGNGGPATNAERKLVLAGRRTTPHADAGPP